MSMPSHVGLFHKLKKRKKKIDQATKKARGRKSGLSSTKTAKPKSSQVVTYKRKPSGPKKKK